MDPTLTIGTVPYQIIDGVPTVPVVKTGFHVVVSGAKGPKGAPQLQMKVVPSPAKGVPTVVPKGVPTVVPKGVPSTQNWYTRLPETIVNDIARDRDVAVNGKFSQKCEQLTRYDEIMPDWLESVLVITIDTLQALRGTKLLMFGVIHNIPVPTIPRLTDRDVMNYMRAYILLKDPDHPRRVILPSILNSCSPECLSELLVTKGVTETQMRFLSKDDRKRILMAGSLQTEEVVRLSALATRYHNLFAGPAAASLCLLYQCEMDDEATKCSVVQKPPHPLENVILTLSQHNPQQLAPKLGIAIPLSQTGATAAYLQTNIPHYRSVFTRESNFSLVPLEQLRTRPREMSSRYLEKLSDFEIFDYFGVYLPYDSRPSLLTAYLNLLREPRFMYPTKRSLTASINPETISGTPITDINVFMVCYGSPERYYTYEITDLIGAFYKDSETGIAAFRHPENTNLNFSDTDVDFLVKLLTSFSPSPEIKILTETIQAIVIDAREFIAGDRELLSAMQKFLPVIKDKIRAFLHEVFECGMYMRRWKGPGHPYPIRAEDTRAPNWEDVSVQQCIGRIFHHLRDMGKDAADFCMRLKLCEYQRDGTIEHGHIKFKAEWKNVVSGENCIRIASARFVGTGYHYLRVLFRITIPALRVHEVRAIS